MNHKQKAIELLGEKKDDSGVVRSYELGERIGSNQMHSKAIDIVVGLLEEKEEIKKRVEDLLILQKKFGDYHKEKIEELENMLAWILPKDWDKKDTDFLVKSEEYNRVKSELQPSKERIALLEQANKAANKLIEEEINLKTKALERVEELEEAICARCGKPFMEMDICSNCVNVEFIKPLERELQSLKQKYQELKDKLTVEKVSKILWNASIAYDRTSKITCGDCWDYVAQALIKKVEATNEV